MKKNIVLSLLFVAITSLFLTGAGSAWVDYNGTYNENQTLAIVYDGINTGGAKLVQKEPEAIDKGWNVFMLAFIFIILSMGVSLVLFVLGAVSVIFAWIFNMGGMRERFKLPGHH